MVGLPAAFTVSFLGVSSYVLEYTHFKGIVYLGYCEESQQILLFAYD